MSDSLLTVIFVSYNSFDTLTNCLGAWLGNPSVRIIVVDNASRDGSAQKIREHYPAVEVLAQQINLGYGRAANRALREVTTPYSLLLNPDIMARESDALALVERMRTLGDDVAVLAPAVRERDYTRTGIVRKPWVIGAAMLFNMRALEAVGLFDENIFLFSEETDLCHRINRQGLAICLDSDLYIRHLSKQSSAPNAAVEWMKDWHFAWSNMYVNHKHGLDTGRRRPWRVLLPYALKSLLSANAARRRRNRAKLAGALAWCRGETAFLPDGSPQQSPARQQRD
jgi:GT2 family glycosyltransferase